MLLLGALPVRKKIVLLWFQQEDKKRNSKTPKKFALLKIPNGWIQLSPNRNLMDAAKWTILKKTLLFVLFKISEFVVYYGPNP